MGNSGRLKSILSEIAAQRRWSWNVDLEFSPDQILTTSSEIIVTTDSLILDRCGNWLNAARVLIQENIHHATVIELNGELNP